MSAKKDSRVLAVVDRALRGEPWHESSWEARPRQFGRTMLETLRESLNSHQVATSVAAGYTAARSESPLAPTAYHETWARMVLLWSARQLIRASFEDPGAAEEKVRTDLWQMASEIIAASDHLNGYKTTDLGAWPTERIVDAARESLGRLRDRIILDSDAARFLATYLDQCKHIMSLLAAGKQSVDSLLRGTIIRIDRAARQENLRAWTEAPLATRQAWVRRVVIEAAWALSDAIPHEYSGEERAKQACLWLVRTACQVAARADRVSEWVPSNASDKAKQNKEAPPRAALSETVPKSSSQKKQVKEPRMEDKKKVILKTLETDATDAAWRLAGSQFLKLAREPLVALLSKHLGENEEDPSIRNKIGAFLDTDIGEALMASLLSTGLSMLPTTTGDVPKRLARELRVRAMSDAGDMVADVLMGPLREVAVMYLQNVQTSPEQSTSEAAGLPVESETPRVRLSKTETQEQEQPVTVGDHGKSGSAGR